MSWTEARLAVATCSLVALAMFGCGSSPAAAGNDAAITAPDTATETASEVMTTPDVASTPESGSAPEAGALVGLWVGTTSQGLPIRIAVDAGIMVIEFGWSVPMCASTTTVTFGAPVPIVAGAFSTAIPGGPGGVRGQIDGRFASERMLAGTLSFMVVPIPNVASCSGSDSVSYIAAPG